MSAILNTCSTPSGGESRGLEFEPKLTKKSKKGLVLGLVCDIMILRQGGHKRYQALRAQLDEMEDARSRCDSRPPPF